MMKTMMALRDWAVTIEALGMGTQILLIRKGGIHEETRDFQVESDQFLLYPAYEHQNEKLLKPEYKKEISRILKEWDPKQDTTKIQYYASLYEDIEITDEEDLYRLYSHHIWTNQFALDRLKWKKLSPLHLLLVRVFRLEKPITIPIREEYVGCKSWLQLPITVDKLSLKPILSDEQFMNEVGKIKAKLC
jgi:hypothetical protein